MIGLFIGSFDPVTLAHINICLNLKNDFKKIVMVPVNSNGKNLIDINYRIDMLNIIKNKYDFIEISTVMKKYSYLNYRIIDLLKEEYHDINIIMGSDLLEKLIYFDNYEYLLSNYNYTIVPRGNINVEELINDKYNKYKDKFRIIDFNSDISSTKVKQLLKENKDTSDALDIDIYNYIRENNLY